jgi:uncharacterized protein (TIGR02594 family)
MSQEFVSAKYTYEHLTVDYAAADGSHLLRTGGTIAWRFNNPGNLRPAKAGVAIYGAIGVGKTKSNGEFLIFASYEKGRAQKKALLRRKYNERTIYTMLAGVEDKDGNVTQGYAPASDNNDPQVYADAISKQTGFPTTKKLSDLTDAQLDSVLDAMEKHEGFHNQQSTRKEQVVNTTTVTISDGTKPKANLPVKIDIGGTSHQTKTDDKGQLPLIAHLDIGKTVNIFVASVEGEWKKIHDFVMGDKSNSFALFNNLRTYVAPTDLKKVKSDAPSKRQPVHYVIQPGDTLSKIAKIYKTTAEEIKKDNPQIKDEKKIFPSQVISIYGSFSPQTGVSQKQARPKLEQVPKKRVPNAAEPAQPAAASIPKVEEKKPPKPPAEKVELARSKDGKGEPIALLQPDQQRAPWMAVAVAEAKRWAGKTEDVITETSNYHELIGVTSLKTLKGTLNAWCASFVNYCLSTAHPAYVKWKNPMRARGVASDPNFVEIKTPIFGAIALIGTHHATLVYAKSGHDYICLGGNQSDQINFSPFRKGVRFFVPVAYQEFAKKDIEKANTLAEHSAEELNKEFGIKIKSKKGNATR